MTRENHSKNEPQKKWDTVFTRESATEMDYQERVSKLLENYSQKSAVDWDLDKDGLIKWLTTYRDTLSKASWRRQRAALVWFMREIEMDPALSERIKEISTEGCLEKGTRTSASKAKNISEKDFNVLANELLEQAEKDSIKNQAPIYESLAMKTLAFLWAGVITGLRPSEWESHELNIDERKLIVQNGKASNGRSNGESRTIFLTEATEEEWEVVKLHSGFVKNVASELPQGIPSDKAPNRYRDILEEESPFSRYQKSCKNRIYAATKKLWPRRKKRPSLYTGRHQFSANLKSSRADLRAIAALMGHGTDRTATEHYGKGRYGSGRSPARADDAEASRVRQVFSSRPSGTQHTGPSR
ncbi:site-specific integrase [Marinobacterium jannaschii]|uniref:site-specific integrase n=1 Tax=Marinobacterium jannaschii TaxID=64970 RepID=UPI00047F47C7|nr:site-specific integrase [Marinobacterium jannaschii]